MSIGVVDEDGLMGWGEGEWVKIWLCGDIGVMLNPILVLWMGWIGVIDVWDELEWVGVGAAGLGLGLGCWWW